MIIIHDTSKWFKDKSLLKYFESDFKMNTMGTFKAPRHMVEKFNNFATEDDKARAINSLGNIAIAALQSYPRARILKDIEFSWLDKMPEVQEALRQAVCEAVQHTVLNRNVYEKLNSSNITTPTITTNIDSTNWLLSSDYFGIIFRNVVENARIDRFEIVGDDFLGAVHYKDSNDHKIIRVWDNTTLGKNLGTYVDLQTALATFLLNATKVDKYDYVMLKRDTMETWRFDGGDEQIESNWDRKDIKYVEGNKYLVYGQKIIVGFKGKDGTSLNIKGTVPNVIALPQKPNKNDAYIAQDTKIMWLFDGTDWINMGTVENAVAKDLTALKTENEIHTEAVNGTPAYLDTKNANFGIVHFNNVVKDALKTTFSEVVEYANKLWKVVMVARKGNTGYPQPSITEFIGGGATASDPVEDTQLDLSVDGTDTTTLNKDKLYRFGNKIYQHKNSVTTNTGADWTEIGAGAGRTDAEINQLIDTNVTPKLNDKVDKTAFTADQQRQDTTIGQLSQDVLNLAKTTDKEHVGNHPFPDTGTVTSTIDASTWVDQFGDVFSFDADKRFDIYLTEIANATQEFSVTAKVGGLSKHLDFNDDQGGQFVGNIKVDTNGIITITKTGGTINPNELQVAELVEPFGVKGNVDSKFGDGADTSTQTGAGYSKSEADALLDKLANKTENYDNSSWKTQIATANWGTPLDVKFGLVTDLIYKGKEIKGDVLVAWDGSFETVLQSKEVVEKLIADAIASIPTPTGGGVYVSELNYARGKVINLPTDEASAQYGKINFMGVDVSVSKDSRGQWIAETSIDPSTEQKLILKLFTDPTDNSLIAYNDTGIVGQFQLINTLSTIDGGDRDSAPGDWFCVDASTEKPEQQLDANWTPITISNFWVDQSKNLTTDNGYTQSQADTKIVQLSQVEIEKITGRLGDLLTTNKGNLSAAINELVGDVSAVAQGTSFKGVYGSEADRDTANPSPLAGWLCVIKGAGVNNSDLFQIYDGAVWQNLKLPEIKVEFFDYNKTPGQSDPSLQPGEKGGIWTPSGTFPLTPKITGMFDGTTKAPGASASDTPITTIGQLKSKWAPWQSRINRGEFAKLVQTNQVYPVLRVNDDGSIFLGGFGKLGAGVGLSPTNKIVFYWED